MKPVKFTQLSNNARLAFISCDREPVCINTTKKEWLEETRGEWRELGVDNLSQQQVLEYWRDGNGDGCSLMVVTTIRDNKAIIVEME